MRKGYHLDGACGTFLRVGDGEPVDDALQNQLWHGAVVGQNTSDLFEGGGVAGLVFEDGANKVGVVGKKFLREFFFKLIGAEKDFAEFLLLLGDFCFVHLILIFRVVLLI